MEESDRTYFHKIFVIIGGNFHLTNIAAIVIVYIEQKECFGAYRLILVSRQSCLCGISVSLMQSLKI